MKYVYVKEKVVHEIIPETSDVFPGVPIERRYSPEFLSHCIQVNDDTPVKTGQIYEEGAFHDRLIPEPTVEEQKEHLLLQKQAIEEELQKLEGATRNEAND